MTLIEIFDRSAIENIAPAICCRPDRIVFIGDKTKAMAKKSEIFKEILAKRGINAELVLKSVNKNNLSAIISLLSALVEKYGDCVFDLTGGADTYLVAIGVVMERYGDKVQCHRFNIRSGKCTDCDADGNVCGHTNEVSLSVEENINAYGGRVVRSGEGVFSTHEWSFDEDFRRDVFAMWDICRKDARRWNAQIGALGALCQVCKADPLSVSISRENAQAALAAMKERLIIMPDVLTALEGAGLISELEISDNIAFRFKNGEVKRCLSVAGQILELVIAFRMREIKDEDGKNIYNDVRVGVVIDWDGYDKTDTVRTVNEIDVFAMKGVIPLFISCKNGSFDTEEIYKLNTVAERFGDEYAIKVIVASELEKLGSRADYLWERADDTGIKMLKNVDEMKDGELDRILRTLWMKK